VGVNCTNQHIIIVDGRRQLVQTHGRIPIWTLFKEYINSLPIGYTFNRKSLLNAIYTVNMSSYATTADQYRNFVTHLGFLQHESTSRYIKKCDIPMRVTITKVRKALVKDWTEWFIPVYERLGISESEAPK